MTITVDHPVLGKVKFPDTATPEQINNTLLKLGTDLLPEGSSGEVFFNQMGEGLESSIEGLSNITGLGFYEDSYEDEFRSRVQLEQSPIAGYGGNFIGNMLDPVTLPAAFLKPIAFGSKVLTGIGRGGAAGAAGGLVEPVFEEFGDSRLLNTTVGGVFGGALGGALSKFIARDIKVPTKQDTEKGVDAALEDAAEAVDPPVKVADDEVITPAATPTQRVESELVTQAQRGLSPVAKETRDEYRALVQAAKDAKAKVTQAEADLARAKNNESLRLRAQQKLDAIKKDADKITKRLDDVKAGNKAQANLNALRRGVIDQLSPDVRIKYNQARAEEAGAVKVADDVTVEQPTPVTEAPVTPRQAPPTDEAEEFAPLRMGTEARESAGSAGVRPEQQFAQQVAEGVNEEEMVATAWSLKNRQPAGSKGFDETDADLRRAAGRESAAEVRLRDLMGHKFGSYTFKDNPELEIEARQLIGEDYDSIVEWLMDSARKGRVFNAQEQRILEPLRAEAEQRIRATYKAMREMRRQGSFRTNKWTQEEYDSVMELQFYSYIADAIDTNGTRASHALKEIQNIKMKRKQNAGKIKAGKPIDDIFGVKC